MSEEGKDRGFVREEAQGCVGMANGCAIQVILGGAVIFLLIVLGYHVF